MQRWNWFLSANVSGKWILTNGRAEVVVNGTTLRATLRFSPDTDPYHLVDATVDSDGGVNALVSSPPGGADPFRLMGRMESQSLGEEGEVTTVLLTDGFTVLGLAHGPRSDEGNL
jgi:hypothetical protein